MASCTFFVNLAPCTTSPKAKRLDKSTEDSVTVTKILLELLLYKQPRFIFSLNIMSETLPIPKTINIVTKIAATILFISKNSF